MTASSEPCEGLSATKAHINLDALLYNLEIFRESAADVEIMAVVKANAYGHGVIPVARSLERAGVKRLAVATVGEGIELRNSDIESRILVFAAPRAETASAYKAHNLEATITGVESVSVFPSDDVVDVHLNIDTGMGRVGIQPSEIQRVIATISESTRLNIKGLATHFATSGKPNSDFARHQWSFFQSLLENELLKNISGTLEVHAASSSAAFTVPQSVDPAIASIARIGVGLYGLLDLPDTFVPRKLRPVMTLRSEIAHIKLVSEGTSISYGRTWISPRQTRVATIAAGYADGVPRMLSNIGIVKFREHSFPIVGAVCMDMFMIDVGPADETGQDVKIGDEVVIFGEGGPSAIDIADAVGTIPYEIVCGIGGRVPRCYTRD